MGDQSTDAIVEMQPVEDKLKDETVEEVQQRENPPPQGLTTRRSKLMEQPVVVEFKIVPFSSKLKRNAKERTTKTYLLGFALYFICMVTFLTMEAYPPDQYEMDNFIRTTFIKEPYDANDHRTMMDIDNIDKMFDWIQRNYIPNVWHAVDNNGFANPVTLLSLPPIVQLYRNIETPCRNSGVDFTTCVIEDSTVPDVDLNLMAHLIVAPGCADTESVNEFYSHSFWNESAGGEKIIHQVAVPTAITASDFFDRLKSSFTKEMRRLRLETVFYNPQTDFVGMFFLVFYVSPTGVVIPFASAQRTDFTNFPDIESLIQSFRIIRPATYYDRIQIMFSSIFLGMTFIMAFFEIGEIMASKRLYGYWWKHYINDAEVAFWNWLDLVNMLVVFGLFIIKVYLASYEEAHSTVSNPAEWRVLEVCGQEEHRFFFTYLATVGFTRGLQSFLIIVVVFRIFKYLRLYPQTSFITATLGKATKDLAYFLFIFLFVVIGYAFTLYYNFGHGNFRFSRPILAFEQTLTFLLGEFDYSSLNDGIDNSYGIIPFLFYWSLVFLVYFILVNIFLAIVLGAYESVKEQKIERETQERVRSLTLFRDIFGNLLYLRKPFHKPWTYWYPETMVLDILEKNNYIEDIKYSIAKWECTVPTRDAEDKPVNELVLGFTLNELGTGALLKRKAKQPMELFIVFSRDLITDASVQDLKDHPHEERVRLYGLAEEFGDMLPLSWGVHLLDDHVVFGFSFPNFQLTKDKMAKFTTLGCEISNLEFVGSSLLKFREFSMHITSQLNLLIIDRECRRTFQAVPQQTQITSEELIKILVAEYKDCRPEDLTKLVTRMSYRYSLASYLIGRFKKDKAKEKTITGTL